MKFSVPPFFDSIPIKRRHLHPLCSYSSSSSFWVFLCALVDVPRPSTNIYCFYHVQALHGPCTKSSLFTHNAVPDTRRPSNRTQSVTYSSTFAAHSLSHAPRGTLYPLYMENCRGTPLLCAQFSKSLLI